MKTIVRAPKLLSVKVLIPCGLALVLSTGSGCFDGDGSSGPMQHVMPRKTDPEITHSWQVPPDKSVLGGGDLGSNPPALADALMQTSAAPSIAHRIALACAEKGVLANTATVGLRFTIAEGGAVASLEGDPAGAAATCLADAFREELTTLDPLPAGAALLVLRFYVRPGT